MKRIGSSVIVLLALVLPDAYASKKKADAEYALVGVSVFREPGLSLPDANVTLVPDPEPGQAPVKIKKLEAVSDSRVGERLDDPCDQRLGDRGAAVGDIADLAHVEL